MTFEKMLELANALGDDALVDVFDNNKIFVELNDFDGFDENWNEIYRDYDNEKAVKDFRKMLHDKAIKIDDDFYIEYYFDGFSVELGFASYNI